MVTINQQSAVAKLAPQPNYKLNELYRVGDELYEKRKILLLYI